MKGLLAICFARQSFSKNYYLYVDIPEERV